MRPAPGLRRRAFRSLASRLTAFAILQVVLLAAAGAIIVFATKPLDEARPEDHLDPVKLESYATAEDALYKELARLRAKRISVSIYNANRQLVATNVDPPLAIPPLPRIDDGPGGRFASPRGRPPPPLGMQPRRDRPFVMPFHIDGERGFLVARGELARPPGWTGPILILISCILILVLGAVANARWIARPIHRITTAARTLGSGDLSARTRLQRTDEIGELGRRFDEMADRIQSLMRSEKELFANVAHELRTPLSRIGVALDLAADGDARAARESLDEIAIDVDELERIVDDILTAMRFELGSADAGGSMPLRRQSTQPETVANAAIERHEARHPERALETNIAPGLPAINVDPMLLRRVLDNLLENAHKYTRDAAPIKLTARADTAHVVFEVSDQGIGIPKDELQLVFAPFFRSDRSRSRETGGVGLGLTLAKRIVEAHGGTISVRSEVDVGTTVTVEIPTQS